MLWVLIIRLTQLLMIYLSEKRSIHLLIVFTSQPHSLLFSNFSLFFPPTPPTTGPCKQLAPYFKDLAKKYTNVNFIKIDFDDFEEVADKYNVASLPTLVFFKDGKAVHMNVGVNKEKIQAAFDEHFGPVA